MIPGSLEMDSSTLSALAHPRRLPGRSGGEHSYQAVRLGVSPGRSPSTTPRAETQASRLRRPGANERKGPLGNFLRIWSAQLETVETSFRTGAKEGQAQRGKYVGCPVVILAAHVLLPFMGWFIYKE